MSRTTPGTGRGGVLRTSKNNIHLQKPRSIMVRVVCPHCNSEVTIDPDAGVEFTCMWCNSSFQYAQEEASGNLSPGTLWLESTIDTENEFKLMDGQKARAKDLDGCLEYRHCFSFYSPPSAVQPAFFRVSSSSLVQRPWRYFSVKQTATKASITTRQRKC